MDSLGHRSPHFEKPSPEPDGVSLAFQCGISPSKESRKSYDNTNIGMNAIEKPPKHAI